MRFWKISSIFSNHVRKLHRLEDFDLRLTEFAKKEGHALSELVGQLSRIRGE
jgi:hypothetical protein